MFWKSVFFMEDFPCLAKRGMLLQIISHCKETTPLAKSVESNFWGVSFLVKL